MRKVALWLSIVGVVALNGCGSSGGGRRGRGGGGGASRGGGGNGGTTGSGGTGGAVAACGLDDTGNGGDSCNAVTPSGPCVTQQNSTATPPTAAGGPIMA